MEFQAEGGVEVGSRVKDQRFKVRGGVRGGGGGRALSRREVESQIGSLIQDLN
jgi:hypothetical protein